MRRWSTGAALFCFAGLACQPDLTDCVATERALPLPHTTVPAAVPGVSQAFDLSYGTAIEYVSGDIGLDGGLDSVHSLDIVLSRDQDVCPLDWLKNERTRNSDTDFVWFSVPLPPFALPKVYTMSSVATIMPYAVASTTPSGASFAPRLDDLYDWPSGTITITTWVPQQEVAGTYDLTFDNGGHFAGSFDVPYCSPKCPVH